MHSIHTTPGFIIDSRPSGEAGKLLSIFTRDLGLVLATAQGIRLEKSKLRYHAQNYSFGVFSFVRGKEFWRITSSQESHTIDHKELVARIALLLRRLLHGEEAHPELFRCVKSCEEFLAENPVLSVDQLKTLESVVVLRMLHTLGYIGNDLVIKGFLNMPFTPLSLGKVDAPMRSLINRHINKALKESHL